MSGVSGYLGQAVVAERRDAERLPHRDAALPRESRGREHAHRGQLETALRLRLDQVRRVRRHRQDVRAAMLLDEPQGVLGAPPVDEHSRGAVEQRREVAEHEAADETELAHDEVDVLAGQLPALADALGGVAQRVVRVGDALRGRGRPGGVEHHRQVVGVTRDVLVRRVVLGQAVDELGLDREEQRDLIGDLPGTSRAPSRRRSRAAPWRRVCAISADSWVSLNIGGSGAITTPRCMQPSIATAASIEWRPRRIDDVARLDTALREPERHADRGTPELIERERRDRRGSAPACRGFSAARRAKSLHRSPSRQYPSA